MVLPFQTVCRLALQSRAALPEASEGRVSRAEVQVTQIAPQFEHLKASDFAAKFEHLETWDFAAKLGHLEAAAAGDDVASPVEDVTSLNYSFLLIGADELSDLATFSASRFVDDEFKNNKVFRLFQTIDLRKFVYVWITAWQLLATFGSSTFGSSWNDLYFVEEANAEITPLLLSATEKWTMIS